MKTEKKYREPESRELQICEICGIMNVSAGFTETDVNVNDEEGDYGLE